MKLLLVTLALGALHSPASAVLIAKGSKFADAEKALTKNKYIKTGLDVESLAADQSLDFWAVDEGVLTISYSTTTGLIESLSFVVMDERPKGVRKQFDFSAVSFDTDTGTLILNTRKPR